MQRMFFHNQHDKDSRDILDALDDDVIVYDVFNMNRLDLPPGIELSVLPYMVDKYISFVPAEQYTVDTPFILTFKCMNYLDEHLTDENSTFRINVNGIDYDYDALDGKIEMELTCPDELDINIQIKGDGYLPFKTVVSISA